MDIHTAPIDKSDMRCSNCVHFNPLPQFEHTGVCDAEAVNKRFNIPTVLTERDDVCWEWEEEKGVMR